MDRNASGTKNAEEGLDQVDAMGVAGFHESGIIYEKVDTTLNNVISRISQLRSEGITVFDHVKNKSLNVISAH